MDWIQIAGHVGAFLSSVTFIPQVYKVWQTKSANDLSLTMMVIVFTSTLIWLVYGGTQSVACDSRQWDYLFLKFDADLLQIRLR